MLAQLGAEPVGMPVPQVTEALSKGVIDGTTIPWEVTPSLKVAELVHNHTGFSGENGLYTQTFGFVMNLDSYNRLPDDLKKVIDDNSGLETAKMFGRAMDEGDKVGLKIAEDMGNSIVTLDEAETARWKAAAQPTIDKWIADMNASGNDGTALYEAAKAALAARSRHVVPLHCQKRKNADGFPSAFLLGPKVPPSGERLVVDVVARNSADRRVRCRRGSATAHWSGRPARSGAARSAGHRP